MGTVDSETKRPLRPRGPIPDDPPGTEPTPVKAVPHKDMVTVLTAPVQFMLGDTVRIRSAGRAGDASTTNYRDGIRDTIRKGLEAGRLLISPYMVLRVMTSAGYDYVPEGGMTGMVEALTAVASDPVFNLEPLTVLAWGIGQITFKPRGVPLEEALRKECPDIFERIHIVSPTSYVILTDLDFARKKTAEARLARIEASILESKSDLSLMERLFAMVEHVEYVTTGGLHGRLAETDEERADPDGKFRKRIAEALRDLRFRPETVMVDGKRTKVFRSPVAEKKPYQPRETPEPKEVQDIPTEEPEADPAEEPEESAEDLGADPGGPEGPGQEPEDDAVSPDRKDLPTDWKVMVRNFLQGSLARSFMSLEELILRAMNRVPQEIGTTGRSRVSKYMMSLGLGSTSFGDRKVFHPEGNVPSDEVLRDHFAQLDREIMGMLDISVSDAPPWMNESQRVNLSYLEHAALLLCEEGTHTRSGLFPGHPSVDWQRRVMNVFQSFGLVSVHGSAFFTTYSGMKPAIEQALDRDFLLGMFWKKEVARASSLAETRQDGDTVREDEVEVEAVPGEEDGPEPGIPELVSMITDMYAALNNHAEEIRKLKKRVKQLEGERGSSDA